MRELAAKMSTSHYAAIEKAAAHRYEAPIRIRNLRVFDAEAGKVSPPMSVVVNGKRIAALDSANAPPTEHCSLRPRTHARAWSASDRL